MAIVIFHFHIETWKGGGRKTWGRHPQGCFPGWESPGGLLGCNLLSVLCCSGSVGRRVENGTLPWLLCQLGLLGVTWQPAWLICIFTASGLLTKRSLQIFKLLDSRESPQHSWSFLFCMATAANFTFLNYEEGLVVTFMPMGVTVITKSGLVLFLLPFIPCPFFQAFKVCQFLEDFVNYINGSPLCCTPKPI